MSDDERWDVTDAAGVPTGRTHRRGDPDFPPGMYHVVASVCVVRADGLVLMTRRAAVKDWPLCWEFPAGSALAGESSAEGAARELAEETGVVVSASHLELVGRVTEESALFDLYAARVAGSPTVVIDPDEVHESEWVGLAEALRRCDAGLMAGPWVERLRLLRAPIAAIVGT